MNSVQARPAGPALPAAEGRSSGPHLSRTVPLTRREALAGDRPHDAAQIYAARNGVQGPQALAVFDEVKSTNSYLLSPAGPSPVAVGGFDPKLLARNIAILGGAGRISTNLIPEQIVCPGLAGQAPKPETVPPTPTS